MKRFPLVGFGILGLMGSFLAGCPIFSDGDGPQGECAGYGCVSNNVCTQPTDCPANETCGLDGSCHQSDCSAVGCPNGYSCDITVNDGASCVSNSGNGGSGLGGGTSNGGATASTASSSTTTSTSGGGSATTSSTGSNSGPTTASSGATTSSSSGGGGTTTTTSSSGTTTSSSGTTTSSSSSSSGTPAVIYCGKASDCASGTICNENGTCQPGPCSVTNACISGFQCNAGDGTCQPEGTGSCDTDADCASSGAGWLCVAGSQGAVCTPPANQCFDQSQCDVGMDCVSGKCVLACASNAQCRDGYDCNTQTGVCTVVAQACTVTNDCGSPTLVCVAGACVPRANASGSCDNPNDVVDENGCVPDQQGTFTCGNDGQQGACNAGSICLHHDCWISCDPTDPNNVCVSNPTLDECKPVTASGTTYDVCGSSSNLGDQCGAGSPGNASCTGGQVCIDGYCK